MGSLHWILVAVATGMAILAAGHALLRKRHARAAFGWIAICLTFPIFGSLLYFLFGINRIHTRARELGSGSARPPASGGAAPLDAGSPVVRSSEVPPELREVARVSQAVTGAPLLGGNRIETLHDGEGSYPAMLDAIAGARRSVYLATYIFESNRTGYHFVDALARAARRGVEVRVLIDGFGELYARRRMVRVLRRAGVRAARFLPPRLLPPTIHVNLRNHRKILVADGTVAFTGGINVGDRHLAADLENPRRVVDLHFRLEGPVVTSIERVFLDDWAFAAGELLDPSAPVTKAVGDAVCRVIVDGPNEDIDKLDTVLVGAVSAARHRVAIMTPYFLPPRELIGALQGAALRGVEVAVILPAENNLPYVHWASRNMHWELLQRGVRIYYQPPPFVHSKLFVVDDHYVQIGSANVDPRSLRLNFELVVEVYDPTFAAAMTEHFDAVRTASREVTLEEVDGRPFLERVRDGVAWLFSPHL